MKRSTSWVTKSRNALMAMCHVLLMLRLLSMIIFLIANETFKYIHDQTEHIDIYFLPTKHYYKFENSKWQSQVCLFLYQGNKLYAPNMKMNWIATCESCCHLHAFKQCTGILNFVVACVMCVFFSPKLKKKSYGLMLNRPGWDKVFLTV